MTVAMGATLGLLTGAGLAWREMQQTWSVLHSVYPGSSNAQHWNRPPNRFPCGGNPAMQAVRIFILTALARASWVTKKI